MAAAHGGVIIDGGFTDHYEWIAMASPYPVTPGETIVTVLIYDIETYAPINGLSPSLELSPPGEPRPCCSGDKTLGPLPLIVDPILYPGDYSNIALLLREGAWQGKFTIQEDDPVGPGELTEIFFTVDIREAEEGEARATPLNAPEISLTATAAAKDFTAGGGAAEPAANNKKALQKRAKMQPIQGLLQLLRPTIQTVNFRIAASHPKRQVSTAHHTHLHRVPKAIHLQSRQTIAWLLLQNPLRPML